MIRDTYTPETTEALKRIKYVTSQAFKYMYDYLFKNYL